MYYDIEVPDFGRGRCRMSGLLLSSDPRPAVSSDTDRIKAYVPIAPTARREFSATDKVTAFAKIYQGGRDPAGRHDRDRQDHRLGRRASAESSRARYRRRRRARHGSSAAEARDERHRSADRSHGEFRMDLPLRTLPAGEYLLTLEASTSRGQARRRRADSESE